MKRRNRFRKNKYRWKSRIVAFLCCGMFLLSIEMGTFAANLGESVESSVSESDLVEESLTGMEKSGEESKEAVEESKEAVGESKEAVEESLESVEESLESIEESKETKPLEEQAAKEASEDLVDAVATLIYQSKEGERKQTFDTLKEALFAAVELKAQDVPPVIMLQDDIHLTMSLFLEQSGTFTLDFNGHVINMSEDVTLDFLNSSVILQDSTMQPISLDGKTNHEGCGGILGERGALLATSGSVKLASGYYKIQSGTIVKNASVVTVKDAILCSPNGMITSDAKTLNINGGFLVYESKPCPDSCKLTILNQGELKPATLLLKGNPISGYAISTITFLVTVLMNEVEVEKNPVYECATFEQAFSKAAQLSSSTSGVPVALELADETVSCVTISQTYHLSSTMFDVLPVVQINNLTLSRGTNQTEALFDIEEGCLILKDCTLDGSLEEKQMSEGSMVIVEKEGVLKLTGTEEKGTKVIQNHALSPEKAADPGAGIWVKNGGIINLSGKVWVNNNKVYTPAEVESVSEREELKPGTSLSRNIYLEDNATLVIGGPILTTESYRIGITPSTKMVDGKKFGYVAADYAKELSKDSTKTLGLSPFFMDNDTIYSIVYDEETRNLYWERPSLMLLPEAGILRIEFVVLFIGLIGFIFRNFSWIKGNKGAERYVTILSILFLVLGCAIGFKHIYQEQQLYARNQRIVENMFLADQKDISLSELKNENASDLENQEEEASLLPEDGRDYIGMIEIESLGIKLPVLSTYTEADMKTSPCVYYGSVEAKDLVITGHNYDTQFGDFNKLTESDPVLIRFTTKDQLVYEYECVAIEQLNPDQIEEMLAGEWDMTLFTCSYSGEKRIALRCRSVR